MAETSWPFPHSGWPDPPWTMAGSVLTAWFDANATDVKRLAHPDFHPYEERVRCRLRFYSLQVSGEDRHFSFREVVVAYRLNYRGVVGELSALMWTDSLTYLTWGREVFGWPLALDEITLDGGLWIGDHTGMAACALQDDVSLRNVEIEGLTAPAATSTAPTWIVPRRLVQLGNSEERRVHALRPNVLDQGRRFQCRGVLDVGRYFTNPSDIDIDFIDGVRLKVGTDAELIT